MRRVLFALSLLSLTFVLSSCFALQSFGLLAGAVNAGGKTKAQFELRPLTNENERSYQFVIVGIDEPDGGDLTVGGATWDVKGTFDGPYALSPSVPLPTVLTDDGGCGSNGLAFSDITGVTWKAFLTPTKVRSQGLVAKSLLTDVVVKAKASAATGTNYSVFGVTGVWDDDGDGILEVADTFACFGISTAQLWVNSPPG